MVQTSEIGYRNLRHIKYLPVYIYFLLYFITINLYFVCPINCVLIEISHNFPHESSLEAKVSIFQKV